MFSFHGMTDKWRVTDIGSRVIVAIKILRSRDAGWYRGPPYAVAETVFDEDDIISAEPVFNVDILI
jgi:hypothetical protein